MQHDESYTGRRTAHNVTARPARSEPAVRRGHPGYDDDARPSHKRVNLGAAASSPSSYACAPLGAEPPAGRPPAANGAVERSTASKT